MKIAVFHNLPFGGAKRALYGLVKYLVRAGHQVDVFVPSTANETFSPLAEVAKKVVVLPVFQTPLGFIKSTINLWPAGISLADLEKTQERLATLINQGEYEVVLVEQDQYTMSPFILRYLKKPAVYYCQQPRRSNEVVLNQLLGTMDANLLERIWRKYSIQRLDNIDKTNAAFAKVILTNSYFSRERILGVYGMESFVSYLGVDREVFRPLGIRKRSYVLSVGRITPEKGFDFIIKALSLIKKKIRPNLIIVSNVGWNSWKDYLRKLAMKREVNLEIKSFVSDLELVKFYNQAKLCLYTPYLEPFGLVPLEAMSCGTPVVGIKEGGLRESVIHNKTGLLTERDEEEFARAVTKLLLDQDMYKSMSEAAVKEVSHFWTLEQAGHRLIKHLKRFK